MSFYEYGHCKLGHWQDDLHITRSRIFSRLVGCFTCWCNAIHSINESIKTNKVKWTNFTTGIVQIIN